MREIDPLQRGIARRGKINSRTDRSRYPTLASDLRHLDRCHVRTVTSAEGAPSDHVMAHLDSFRAYAVDEASAYVDISRASEGAAIYTDSRAKLTEALKSRNGAQVGAIDETMGRYSPQQSGHPHRPSHHHSRLIK